MVRGGGERVIQQTFILKVVDPCGRRKDGGSPLFGLNIRVPYALRVRSLKRVSVSLTRPHGSVLLCCCAVLCCALEHALVIQQNGRKCCVCVYTMSLFSNTTNIGISPIGCFCNVVDLSSMLVMDFILSLIL